MDPLYSPIFTELLFYPKQRMGKGGERARGCGDRREICGGPGKWIAPGVTAIHRFSRREKRGKWVEKRDVMVVAVGEVPGARKVDCARENFRSKGKVRGEKNRRKKEKSREDFDPGRRYTFCHFDATCKCHWTTFLFKLC